MIAIPKRSASGSRRGSDKAAGRLARRASTGLQCGEQSGEYGVASTGTWALALLCAGQNGVHLLVVAQEEMTGTGFLQQRIGLDSIVRSGKLTGCVHVSTGCSILDQGNTNHLGIKMWLTDRRNRDLHGQITEGRAQVAVQVAP